jgi:hypothetical protein
LKSTPAIEKSKAVPVLKVLSPGYVEIISVLYTSGAAVFAVLIEVKALNIVAS